VDFREGVHIKLIYKRFCNTCGKYYEGVGKLYCSRKCQPSPMKGKEGYRIRLSDGSYYPSIPSLCLCGCNEITWNGHDYIHNHHGKNKSLSTEHKNKIGAKHKGKIHTPEHIENHKKSVTGRKDSEETKERKRISHIGTHRAQETKDKISESNKGIPRTEKQLEIMRGSNNPNWQGGIYEDPYAKEFNINLKEEIRIRDDYQCQNPDCLCTQLESIILYKCSLHAHHIHYDKENPNPDLICLCNSCNAKANFDKDYWEKLYTDILIKRNYKKE
jgi:hypothetical protein